MIKGLDQSKYSLSGIFKNQMANPSVQRMLITFHEKLTQELDRRNLAWIARTHVRGITYLCNEQKAFMGVDVWQQFISTKFFTGNAQIDGLQKANWIRGGDNTGSETYRIVDSASLGLAVVFAMNAHKITVRWVEGV